MKTKDPEARAIPLALLTLIAVFSALATLALSTDHSAHAQNTATPPATITTPGQAAFHAEMRKLWEDHITWTRMVIVDYAAGLPDLSATEQRLLRNQTDIGNAIKPYYGNAAGNTLTKLLRTHILEAVPVLANAKAGDKTKLAQALNAWYANGNQIARFLTKANPGSWPLAITTKMMKTHLALTTQEAVARLQGHWTADIAAYDRVHAEILQMSDMLSDGIVAQFPGRFQ